jgi:hypothetical protein
LLENAGLSSTKLRRVVIRSFIIRYYFVMLATALPTLEELYVKVLCGGRVQGTDTSQPTLDLPTFPLLHSPLIQLSLNIYIAPDHQEIVSGFQDAFNKLSLPLLRYLQLSFTKSRPNNDAVVRTIAAVLQRSQSPVEILRFNSNIPQNKDTIAALLRAVPRLEELHLFNLDYEVVDEVLNALMTMETTTELICPHLNRISFKLIPWPDPEECARSLLEFISTRFAAPASKLSRLVFKNPPGLREMDEMCDIMTGSAQFKMYKERGLELQRKSGWGESYTHAYV